jgi:hypothetical protein
MAQSSLSQAGQGDLDAGVCQLQGHHANQAYYKLATTPPEYLRRRQLKALEGLGVE